MIYPDLVCFAKRRAATRQACAASDHHRDTAYLVIVHADGWATAVRESEIKLASPGKIVARYLSGQRVQVAA